MLIENDPYKGGANPTPAPMSLPDIDVPALPTNDYGVMETEVSVSFTCKVCSNRGSYTFRDQWSPDILSVMPQHINTAARRKSFFTKTN